jgi:hypothetical protein
VVEYSYRRIQNCASVAGKIEPLLRRKADDRYNVLPGEQPMIYEMGVGRSTPSLATTI